MLDGLVLQPHHKTDFYRDTTNIRMQLVERGTIRVVMWPVTNPTIGGSGGRVCLMRAMLAPWMWVAR